MITDVVSKEASTLFGKTRRAILALLFTHTDESFYLRQIVRRTGAGLGPVQKDLRLLTDAGIITRRKDGHQVYFRANRESPIFSELKSLIVKTIGLGDELRSALIPLVSRIKIAYIYGSFASGKENSQSDIDLMVVGDVTLREVVSAVSDTGRKLSRVINSTVFDPVEYEERLAEADGFVSRVHNGPKIILIGDKHES